MRSSWIGETRPSPEDCRAPERGVTFVEVVLTLSIASAFILGAIALYNLTSRNAAITDAEKHLIAAVGDMQEAYARDWFGDMNALQIAAMPEVIRDRNTPYGDIMVGISGAADEAPDAFRLGLRDIPYEALADFCEPLMARMLLLPYVDAAVCESDGGAGTSTLEMRVRGKIGEPATILTSALWTGNRQAGNSPPPPPCSSCDLSEWKTPITQQEYLKVKLFVDAIKHMLGEGIGSCAAADILDCDAFSEPTSGTYALYLGMPVVRNVADGDALFFVKRVPSVGDEGVMLGMAFATLSDADMPFAEEYAGIMEKYKGVTRVAADSADSDSLYGRPTIYFCLRDCASH